MTYAATTFDTSAAEIEAIVEIAGMAMLPLTLGFYFYYLFIGMSDDGIRAVWRATKPTAEKVGMFIVLLVVVLVTLLSLGRSTWFWPWGILVGVSTAVATGIILGLRDASKTD